MGMSASQANLLSLTARLSDLEFQAQRVSRSRVDLATSSDKATQEYVDSMDVKKLSLKAGYDNSGNIKYQDLTFSDLTGPGMTGMFSAYQYALTDNYGRVLVSQDTKNNFVDDDGNKVSLETFLANNKVTEDDDNYQYYVNLFNLMNTNGYTTQPDESNTLNNSDWLYSQLKSGNLTLESCICSNGEYNWGTASWQTSTDIVEEDDDTGTAIIKAKYEARLSEIESEDKSLELDLKQIDTEHTAVQTEIETVRKVIDKNEERSFKTFG